MHTPLSNHACPPEQPRMPPGGNHAHPPEQPHMPAPEQPRTPPSYHARSPGATPPTFVGGKNRKISITWPNEGHLPTIKPNFLSIPE